MPESRAYTVKTKKVGNTTDYFQSFSALDTLHSSNTYLGLTTGAEQTCGYSRCLRRNRLKWSRMRLHRFFFVDFVQIHHHVWAQRSLVGCIVQGCHRRVKSVKVITGRLSRAGISHGFHRHSFFLFHGSGTSSGEEERVAAAPFARLGHLFVHLSQRLFVPGLLKQQTVLLRRQQRQRVWSEAVLPALLLVAQLHGQGVG